MKRTILLAAALSLLLCACAAPMTAETTPQTTLAETTVPETTIPETTMPLHSSLYIEGVDVEDVITWFNEVCLDSEFYDSGNPSVIQKWVVPIAYTLEGAYTDADAAKLEEFAAWLSTVEGFPGMAEAADPAGRNLRICFGDAQEMTRVMGDNFYGLDGAVTFWYNENEIYDAVVFYRADIDQYARNSVLLEEIYNGLGPVQDTSLRQDSIIYQEYTTPQNLTAVDELLLKLLYHPDIRPGMNAEECRQIIYRLYY